MLKNAFKVADEFCGGGGGFTFAVTLLTGDRIEGIPPSNRAIAPPKDAILELETGEGVVCIIPERSMLMIEVKEA